MVNRICSLLSISTSKPLLDLLRFLAQGIILYVEAIKGLEPMAGVALSKLEQLIECLPDPGHLLDHGLSEPPVKHLLDQEALRDELLHHVVDGLVLLLDEATIDESLEVANLIRCLFVLSPQIIYGHLSVDVIAVGLWSHELVLIEIYAESFEFLLATL